jgi:hypothetical protein
MIELTKESLENAGYKIENAKITFVDLSMADHGCLTLSLCLEGEGWGCMYGGYVLGTGYVGADEFEGSAIGMESIMRIMDTVGCDTFNDMKGEYVRAAVKGWGDRVQIIGHITKDKWFDQESFFKEKKCQE